MGFGEHSRARHGSTGGGTVEAVLARSFLLEIGILLELGKALSSSWDPVLAARWVLGQREEERLQRRSAEPPMSEPVTPRWQLRP